MHSMHKIDILKVQSYRMKLKSAMGLMILCNAAQPNQPIIKHKKTRGDKFVLEKHILWTFRCSINVTGLSVQQIH